MKIIIIMIFVIFIFVLTGCIDESFDDKPIDVPLAMDTPSIIIDDASAIPILTPKAAVKVAIEPAIVMTTEPTPTLEPTKNYNDEMKIYLPQLDTDISYFGYAEYGHRGKMTAEGDDVYRFDGEYRDGIVENDRFSVRYYFDTFRGTITEQVVMTDRNEVPEVNSKLHNVVLLKFPLKLNKKWHHSTMLNGAKYDLEAEIIVYDADTGLVKVRYIVEGVPGYYRDRYIEEREFMSGYGMTMFINNFPGELFVPPVDDSDEAYWEAVRNEMFGYRLHMNN